MTKYCVCGHAKNEHFPVKCKECPSGRIRHKGKDVPKRYCCHSFILFCCSCEKYRESKRKRK